MTDSVEPGRVLIVEDEDVYARAYEAQLSRGGYRTARARDVAAALAMLTEHDPQVVLLDLMLDGRDPEEGFEVLREIGRHHPHVRVIVVTSSRGPSVAEKALQLGAHDFVSKEDRGYGELTFRVNQAHDRVRLEGRIRELREGQVQRVGGYRYGRDGIIVGQSETMRELFRRLEQLAPTQATVLIQGESGTGKELVAQALHANSPRSHRELITVNCGAIPTELVESELFGHARGAFTGALEARAGLFEAAHGSTLFLDEIGDLPAAVQVKLLRVIEQGEVRRVGETGTIPVDVRLVAATHRDLAADAVAGDFRADLYYRLETFVLDVPSLRRRADDIPLLLDHFLTRSAADQSRPRRSVAPEVVAALRQRPWPGNVRQLHHSVHRAVLFAAGEGLQLADFDGNTGDAGDTGAAGGPAPGSLAELVGAARDALARGEERALPVLLARCEAELIRAALEGNPSQQEAARRLGITESGLRGKMDRHEIPRANERP